MSTGLQARLAALSPEKRLLLERRLELRKRTDQTPLIERREGSRHPPLSFAQQRLWFLEQLDPGQASYHLAFSMPIAEHLSTAVVERSLAEVVRRHETLRTTILVMDGDPVQVVAPEGELPLEEIDLRGVADAARQFQRRIEQEAVRGFDLARGPLARPFLFRFEGTGLLFVTMHHVISDAWSLDVLRRELELLLAAFDGGEASPLPELPLQYGDIAVWQRDHLRGERLDELVGYWRRQLDGAPPLLEVPTDFPRPRVQTFDGATYRLPYAGREITALKELARQEESTLFMALLAVFYVLLHRFGGLTDLVVGTPIANRNRSEVEGLIGFFVNSLVLRTDLSGRPTFRELLGRVREVALAAFAHQDLPFEKLVEELSPERNLAYNPLFQVMFTLETAAHRPERNAETELAFGTSKFDLTLDLVETDEGLTGVFEFNVGLFEPQTIRSLAEVFGVLLGEVVRHPDRSIHRLGLLDEATRQGIVADAATPGQPPPALFFHGLYARQAELRADAPAAETPEGELTYGELVRRARRLAHALVAAGAGPDRVVGLCLRRTLHLPVALLAVLEAGAAFAPLDPVYPRERLDYMLSDTGARLVLATSDVADALPPFDGELWLLDREPDRAAGMPETLPEVDLDPAHLAYIIYTSGSTGRPKGVMVDHRSVLNTAQALVDTYRLPPGTRVLQFGAPSFDVSIYDFLMAAGCGGTLVLLPQEDLLPGPPLVESLRRHRVAATTIPPSALAVAPRAELPDLHTLVCGGEALSAELVERWGDGRRMVNAYGPTETAIWSTYHVCTERDAVTAPPIGRAIPNTGAYVLMADGKPAPVGFPGEIYLGGEGVVRGYRNRPARTAAAYVPDPFSGRPGARLYRSGDRARLDAERGIRFLGRFDHQVKLRGYRIELGEIEAVLLRHPAVHEVGVVVYRLPSGDERLAAFCVPAEGARVEPDQLAAHLRQSLPEFMVPSLLRCLPDMPLLATGKLDRRELARQAAEDAIGAGPETLAPPRTELELAVAEIFRDVLEREHQPGMDDNFFSLGGHSLLATRTITRLNERFDANLALRQLFESPTVRQLAAVLEEHLATPGVRQAPEIQRLDREPTDVPEDTHE